MMAWVGIPIAKRCAKCGNTIGQGEVALKVTLEGVTRAIFYCDGEDCGKRMVENSLPQNPEPRPVKPSFGFSAVSNLAERFDSKLAAAEGRE